jgi:hypothetical protein
VRDAWFNLLIILLSPPFLVPDAMQGVRAVRAVRILRLLRFVRAAAVAAIGLREAAQALRHRKFHYVALATAVVISVAAIGIFAVEGVGLMIVGIGFIGVFTATVTSFFFQQERSADVIEMQQRLDRIERKLDAPREERIAK